MPSHYAEQEEQIYLKSHLHDLEIRKNALLELIQKNEVVECNSKKDLKIIDLTGAGDLFAAGFLHGHVNNLSIKESLQKGTEMASKIIQKIGARLN